MPVAERVDHENIDVTAHKQQVLPKARKHMPRIQIQEGCHVVQSKCRCNGDEDNTCAACREEGLEDLVGVLTVEAEPVREGVHHKIDRVHDDVELDDAEEAEGSDVTPLATLGPVTEREYELQENEGEVEILDDGVNDRCGGVAEGPTDLIVSR